MGNSKHSRPNVTKNKNNPNHALSLQDFKDNLKCFINNKEKINFKTPPEVMLPLGIKSSIEEKSNISQHLNSPSSIDLCGDILSLFSNQEIGKVNNGNIYNSILLINIFEENKDNLNSVNSVSSPKLNNITENFTSNIIDKINEVFNINNELFSSEKYNRYKLSSMHLNPAVKDLLNLNLHQEKQEKIEKNEKTHINISMVSDNGNLNEVISPVTNQFTKKFSRLDTLISNKSINTREIEENINNQNNPHNYNHNFSHSHSLQPMPTRTSLNPKKLSSNSLVNIGTLNNEQLPKNKKTLKSINEFEMDLPDKDTKDAFSHVRSLDESISFDKCISPKQKSTLKINKQKTTEPGKKDNLAKSSKRLKYSSTIRQQLLESVKKIRDDKKIIERNGNANESSLTPFDLFSSDMLDQFKEEDKKREEVKKEKINGNWLKSLKSKEGKERKNKIKKTELHFSINLKVIIKKEVEESINFNNPEKKLENKKSKKKDRLVSINSEDFRDSVEKFINIENSLYSTYHHNRNNSSKLYKNQPNSVKLNASKSLFINQESSKKNESQNLLFASSSNINHSNKSLTIISNLEGNISQFKEEEEEASHYTSVNEETI
jgi:hypothetical protein